MNDQVNDMVRNVRGRNYHMYDCAVLLERDCDCGAVQDSPPSGLHLPGVSVANGTYPYPPPTSGEKKMNTLTNWKLFLRRLLPFAFIVIACSATQAQSVHDKFLKDPPSRKKAIISTVFYETMVYADARSSRGLREGNPLLGDGHGGIDMKRGMTAALVPLGVSIVLRLTHHSRAANWLMFGLGGAHGAFAVHNVVIK